MFQPESFIKKDPYCGLNPKVDYEIGTLYGSDPLSGGWWDLYYQPFLYNDFSYDDTFGLAKMIDAILGEALIR